MAKRAQSNAVSVLHVPGVADIDFLPTLRAIHVKWYDFSSDEGFKAVMYACLETVMKRGAVTWIADSTSAIGQVSEASQRLLQNLHAEGSAPRHGLRAIITVEPKSFLPLLSNRRWQREVNNGVFIMESVGSLDDALQVATELYGIVTAKPAGTPGHAPHEPPR